GLLTDEWQSGDTFIQRNTMDQRIWDPQNTFHAGPFRAINRVRVQAGAAIKALRQDHPAPVVNISRMFALIAYVEVLAGEHYCNGVPLSSFSGSEVAYGDPLPNDSLFALAAANADSALNTLSAADADSRGADSLRVKWLAQVVKGRALLDRARGGMAADFAVAATAVAGVPDTFHYDVTYSLVTADNQNWALNVNARRYTMGDNEGDASVGGNVGLPYFSANDPRLPRRRGGPNTPRAGVLDVRDRAPARRHATAAPAVRPRGEQRLSERAVVQGRELRRRDPTADPVRRAEQPELRAVHGPRPVSC